MDVGTVAGQHRSPCPLGGETRRSFHFTVLICSALASGWTALEQSSSARPPEPEEIEQRSGGVFWLTAAELDDLIAGMVRESSRWVRPFGHSSFSLAGAQAKTALHRHNGRWGEPWGDTPSTHILKPSMRDLRDQAVNEHLCLAAARYCGLTAARTEINVIAGHEVLIVRRYDRVRSTGDEQRIHRVHQEDLHQACGDAGASIYQDDRGGGHSIRRLARLIAGHSADRDSDIRAFFDALAFNWVICNTDAHSKNYSLLFTGNSVRFAPLYDIWSILPYDPDHYRAHTLAMSALPDRRIIAADSKQSWEAAATAVGLDRSEGLNRAAAIAEAAPDAITRSADELDADQRSSPIVQSLASMAQHRRTQCLHSLSAN